MPTGGSCFRLDVFDTCGISQLDWKFSLYPSRTLHRNTPHKTCLFFFCSLFVEEEFAALFYVVELTSSTIFQPFLNGSRYWKPNIFISSFWLALPQFLRFPFGYRFIQFCRPASLCDLSAQQVEIWLPTSRLGPTGMACLLPAILVCAATSFHY